MSPTYQTYVFDCDGVVLDSNPLKTDAFRLASLPYGKDAAETLVRYHVENGGISRFHKFRHFLEAIVPAGVEGPSFDQLLNDYANAVKTGLCDCAMAPGLARLRELTAGARWLIVSGGSQAELREIFAKRGIDLWFDGGIFGSPDTKDDILARELANGNIVGPTLFIGDSKYDWRAARSAGLDFVFANYWTEVADWREFTSANGIDVIDSIDCIHSRAPTGGV
jgi:phosphoglycolate phosphatase-like HAD superfamily hydrolase